MNTTLNEIREQSPCHDGWQKLLAHLGKTQADDTELSFSTILKSNGIEDAVWYLRVLDYKDRCLFMADVAESVLHIYESKHKSKAPREAIQAVRYYHDGLIGLDDLRGKCTAAAAAAYISDDSAYISDDSAASAASAADDSAAAAADASAFYAAAAASARKDKWAEIEQLFIKHFCGEALEAK